MGGTFTYNPSPLAYGLHTATIRATDAAGLTGEATLEFRVNTPPVASAGPDQTVNEGDEVTFDGTGSSDTEAALFDYSWTLPDGTTPHAFTVTRTFPQDGSFQATFTVIDTAGSVVTDGMTLTVENLPPDLGPLPDRHVFEFDSVTFLGSFTDPGIEDTHTATVDWGTGAGPVDADVDETGGSGTVSPLTPFAYQEAGTYTVTVRVSDGTDWDEETFQVFVSDVTPSLTISGPPTTDEGSTYTLSLNANGQPGITGWTVNWGDGTVDPLPATATSATHTYVEGPTSFTITAQAVAPGPVTYLSNSLDVTVLNVDPVVDAPTSAMVAEGSTLTLTANFTDAGVEDTHTAVIDWGDGTVDGWDVTESGGSGSVTGTHVYPDNRLGNYSITVTVLDDDGGDGADSTPTTVTNVNPAVTPASGQTAIQNVPITLQVATFSDPAFPNPDGTPPTDETFTVQIAWGDGSTDTFPNHPLHPGLPGPTTGLVRGTHTYATVGQSAWRVTVTVTDDDGGVGQAHVHRQCGCLRVQKFLTVDQSDHGTFR